MGSKKFALRYRACDGFRETRYFATLAGLRKRAVYWVGEHPDLGSDYAVSFDGIGTVRVSGCSIRDVFPEDKGPENTPPKLSEEDRAFAEQARAEREAERANEYILECGRYWPRPEEEGPEDDSYAERARAMEDLMGPRDNGSGDWF